MTCSSLICDTHFQEHSKEPEAIQDLNYLVSSLSSNSCLPYDHGHLTICVLISSHKKLNIVNILIHVKYLKQHLANNKGFMNKWTSGQKFYLGQMPRKVKDGS